jgi:Rrf2 family protein
MLTKTSMTALQSLMFVAQRPDEGPIAPGTIAARLGCSASYLAKIHTQLTKSGILESHRGVRGGITLARPAKTISLLDIVESCQGRILGLYCAEFPNLEVVCGFHQAMAELQSAVVGVLRRWSLHDMASRPAPLHLLEHGVPCKMACVRALPAPPPATKTGS